MPVATMPARQCGKSQIDVQRRLLNALFDAGGGATVAELETSLRVTRRDLWHAIRAQAMLGNVRNVGDIDLTDAARAAIGAGRAVARRTYVVTEEFRAMRRTQAAPFPPLPGLPFILAFLMICAGTIFSLCLIGRPGA